MNPAFVVTTYIKTYAWSSTVGEHLICERETRNSTDRYAVAVLKDDVIIDRLLAKGLMLLKIPSDRVGDL